VWVQGCPFSCPGCVAPEWIPIRTERLVAPDVLAGELLADDAVTGLTISGGEPMLLPQGDREEARTLLEAVAEAHGSEHRPSALLLLGQLASLTGAATTAKNWFDQAIATGDPEVVAEAEAELADLTLPSSSPAPLNDLPARILTLLATVAEAEAKPTEATYWRKRAATPSPHPMS
jgi:hypothetical protein